MGRRFSIGRRTPSAFPEYKFAELDTAVTTLFQRMVATNPQPVLTSAELVSLFAPLEHRDMLRETPRISSSVSYRYREELKVKLGNLGLVEFELINRDDGDGSALMPKNPAVQPDADPEKIAQITQWVTWRRDVGYQFGRVKGLLNRLDSYCKSPRQVRYVWPSVLALARMSSEDAMKDLANELEDFREPRNMPPISAEMREVCRKASTTVAGALLLEERPQAYHNPDVNIDALAPKIEEPWLGEIHPY